MQVRKDADPADKTQIYSGLRLTRSYHPDEKRSIGRSQCEWSLIPLPGNGE
jgi:hypothetical protein